MDNSLVLLAMD